MSGDALTVVASAMVLTIDGQAIRRDGDMWCLTDLWRASGSPTVRRPNDWLSTDVAREFCDCVTASMNPADSSITTPVGTLKKKGNPRSGEPPTTWGHWQIALAYAKALSPAFHLRVNEVWRAYSAGQLVPREPSRDRDDLIHLSLRMSAIERGINPVWDLELKLEMARLRKIAWDGKGVEPKGLTFAYGRTWRIILGDVIYEELKKRNPHPRDGSLHAAWLQERRYQIAKREDLVIALVLARRCSRWTEYETDMRAHFRRAPIQLRLVESTKRRRS